ncbi:MAG: PTS sugar transporter subunit IIA [Candidatus Omnitrophota bacterium]
MSGTKAQDIKLSSLLKEKYIDLDLKGQDKETVIAELVEIIASSRKLKNKKAFFRNIMERESLGSTGIGNGVAIPHAKYKGVKDFILVLARKDAGIDFGALDGERTCLFFALAVPQEAVGPHLKILAEISRLVKDKFIIDSLKKAKSKKDILKIISARERNVL